MGYYTYYQLSILKDPDNHEEQFCKEFDNLLGEGFIKNLLDGGEELKWYSWEKDMKELSELFPRMLFELEGNGEEPLDIWIAHFCNGQMKYREIQTYWEEFSAEEFYNNSI